MDIIDGKCVRLTQGDYTQKKIYSADPLEVAKRFEGAGLRNLHLVDLDGAKAQHIVNWIVLEHIASQTDLNIDFGGGIKSDADIRLAFESGARQVVAGSIAAWNKYTFLRWLSIYGPDKLILGADARDGWIATNGWEEQTSIEVTSFIDEFVQQGVQTVICTDIARDGMMKGPSFALYRTIIATTPEVQLIASGGVSGIADLDTLRETGVAGVIIGKAIYEGRITIETLATLC